MKSLPLKLHPLEESVGPTDGISDVVAVDDGSAVSVDTGPHKGKRKS
jgi:hypothetical protein